MHRLFGLVTLLGLNLLVLAPANAQTDIPRTFSLRPRPASESKAFMILESGIMMNFQSSPYDPSELDAYGNAMLQGSVGYMRNISHRSALGGAWNVVWDFALEDVRWGFGPRYRLWLNRWLAIDNSMYLMLGTLYQEREKLKSPGIALSVAVSLFDWLSIDARYESSKYKWVETRLQYSNGSYSDTQIELNERANTFHLGVTGRNEVSWLATAVVLGFVAIYESSN